MTDAPARKVTVLGGRYQLAEVVGRGGMADVYRAYDTVLHRDVAVKVLRDLSSDPVAAERFAHEARTLARLNHPGLVTVLDAGTSDDKPFLVLELVDHVTLAECCAGTALDPARVAAIGAQLADALAYVHAEAVVHRDVKPGNVLLAAGDRCLLTDFGIAKLLGEVAAAQTATGFTMGTAAYLSPEQVRGDAVGPASDVYSLGLVLLEALSGARAYPGPPTQAALARLSAPPAVPATLPDEWRALIEAMTSLDPADRPSAAEVAERLRTLAGGVGVADATAALRTTVTTRPAATATREAPDVLHAAGRTSVLSRLAEQARQLAAPVQQRWRRAEPWHRWVAVGAVLLLLVALAAVAGGGGAGPDAGEGGGGQVPSRLEQDLQDLREAVNG